MGVQIDTLRTGITNTYVLGERAKILIDPGVARCGATVVRKLRSLVGDPHEVALLIATHGHFDHIGAATAVCAATGAPLAVHRGDAEWVRTGTFQWPDGTTPWGVFMRRCLGPFMIPFLRFSPTEVGIVLGEEGLDLEPYGVSGRVVPTPGHTPGSVSVLLDSGEAFVGDLAMNGLPMTLKPSFGIFAHQPELVPGSWRRLLDLGARTVFPAHGRPFAAARLV